MPRGTRPTPEQKAAREQLAEARRNVLERKKRTRRLIQIGGTLDSYGITTPELADELMRAIVRDEDSRQWLQERGVRPTERWPGE